MYDVWKMKQFNNSLYEMAFGCFSLPVLMPTEKSQEIRDKNYCRTVIVARTKSSNVFKQSPTTRMTINITTESKRKENLVWFYVNIIDTVNCRLPEFRADVDTQFYLTLNSDILCL